MVLRAARIHTYLVLALLRLAELLVQLLHHAVVRRLHLLHLLLQRRLRAGRRGVGGVGRIELRLLEAAPPHTQVGRER